MRAPTDNAGTSAVRRVDRSRGGVQVVAVSGLLVCGVALVGFFASHRRVVTDEVRELKNVQIPSKLEGVYGLGVVEVPEPPGNVESMRAQPSQDCPVEVRAIVRGDEPSSTFAVLGWGENSSLLGKGEGVRTPIGWLAVALIAEDYVVLHHGGEAYHCVLGTNSAR